MNDIDDIDDVYETKAYAKKSLEICLKRSSHDFALVSNKRHRTSESVARLKRKISFCKNPKRLPKLKYALKMRERRLGWLDAGFTNLHNKIVSINRALKTVVD